MFKKYRSVFLLIVFILVLFAVVWYIGQRKGGGDLKVGVILAKSGPADFIGKPESQVLEALINEYRQESHTNPKIVLEIRDSGGNVDQAKTLFTAFADDPNVIAVIGPSTSSEAIPLSDQATEFKIPLLTLAASKQIVFDQQNRTKPWAFKFAQNDDLAAKKLLGIMSKRQEDKVALLFSNDGFGKSGSVEFKKTLEQDFPQLRISHEVPFSATLDQPEAIVAGIPSDVKAIIIWGTAPGPALLIKELKRVNNKAQIYLSHGNASESFIKAAGPSADGSIIVGSRVLTSNQFLSDSIADQTIKKYQEFWSNKNFQGTPSHFGGHARDALEALLIVINKGKHTREEIKSELENLQNFYGVTGTFVFTKDDHAGLDEKAFEIYVIKEGQFIPLEKDK